MTVPSNSATPPCVLPDPIMPPSLAYSFGVTASRRAKYWTGEGYIIPNCGRDGLFCCDCQEVDYNLSDKHPKPKNRIESRQVRDLLRHKGK